MIIEPNTYHIYGDESSKANRFMIVGALLTPIYKEPIITNEVNYLKDKHKSTSEIKWSKLGNNQRKLYKDIIEYSFKIIDDDSAHFKAIILDTNQIDKKRFNETDIDSTTNKMIYQLMANQCIKPYYPFDGNIQYKLLFDSIENSKNPISNCKEIYNNGFKKLPFIEKDILSEIIEINSKESNLMQLTDLLIGGIGYYRNFILLNKHKKGAKYELSNLICEKIGFENIMNSTKRNSLKYSIWNFDYSKSHHNQFR